MILKDFLSDQRTLSPLTLFAVEVKRGELDAIRADVQLEIQVKRGLIPSGVASAGGIAQDSTCLAELL